MKAFAPVWLTIMASLVAAAPLSASETGAGLGEGVAHYWSFDPADDSAGGKDRLKPVADGAGDLPLLWVWPGTWEGEAWLADGVAGKAVIVAPKVRIESKAQEGVLSPNFTAAAWVRLDDDPAANKKRGIFYADNWSVQLVNQKLELAAKSKAVLKSDASLPAATWVHVAVTVSAPADDAAAATRTARLYIDGQEAASGQVKTPPAPTNDHYKKVRLGSNLLGQLDEMTLWERALSASEIAALHGLGGEGVALSSVITTQADKTPAGE